MMLLLLVAVQLVSCLSLALRMLMHLCMALVLLLACVLLVMLLLVALVMQRAAGRLTTYGSSKFYIELQKLRNNGPSQCQLH